MSAGLLRHLLDGLLVTLQLTIFGGALGLVFAVVAGLARLSRSRPVRALAFVYTEGFRGLPALVVLFWFVFALPRLGFQMLPLFAGVLALALNIGAYGAEVVRGAIRAVPNSQLEAATALNFTRWQRMRLVVFPQALVAMVPPFGNLLIELLKATALVSIVYIPDLTFQGQLVRAATGNTAMTFFGLLLGYAVIALAFTGFMRWVERRAATSVGRQPEPGLVTRMIRRREVAA
ncbi:ectoine/hydroxyectoine ABC transporter permease subunit EhuC [Longimycelium tulufanense]|uniref:Ectoine/hydroxyectoine ABC transporter permease subunit EhuC n=1 Tax=Longimycelium tulufanense TaxID=907463 RepID=A0A8J3C626_9PSEU|nr:ectoine/hydroxyectoine ABC transporter permease subunit EhuC [Longimycelium tulufanense]GGM35198.1 ectoine/hydroxyectoine ABC transporter permease subunit EhuC [Longimycelium tulufanense]